MRKWNMRYEDMTDAQRLEWVGDHVMEITKKASGTFDLWIYRGLSQGVTYYGDTFAETVESAINGELEAFRNALAEDDQ